MDIVGAVLVSGGVGAGVAIWGLLSQRAITRRKTTFDHIAASDRDGDVIGARNKFIELAKKQGGLAPWADESKEQTDEVQSIKLVLNEFELVAIGIQRGIVDAELYKRWFRSGVIRHWQHAEPFVSVLRARTGNPALFHEFQEMARWFQDDKMPHRRWWIGRFF